MSVVDGPHDIGCRALTAGVDALVAAVSAFAGGSLKPVTQASGGMLYKNSDFSADAVREMRRRFDAGMIPEYLDAKRERDARHPILE